MALVKIVKCFKIIIRYVSGHVVQSRRISQVVVEKVLVGICYHDNRGGVPCFIISLANKLSLDEE